MMPLVWRMLLPKHECKANGLLILLLIIVTIYFFKPLFSLHGPVKTVQIKDGFFIQVEGDVSSPGVYSFSSQVVPGDVIEKAGGLLPSGDASILSDNMIFESDVRIEIQRKVDGWGLFQREILSFHKLTLGIPISLNSETEEGLTALPGIGPSLARAIVEERARRGGFKKLKEITSIDGIGEGIYKKIAPYVIL